MSALFSIVRGWQLIEMTSYDDVLEANKRVQAELADCFDQFPRGTEMTLTIYNDDIPVSSKSWLASGKPARCA